MNSRLLIAARRAAALAEALERADVAADVPEPAGPWSAEDYQLLHGLVFSGSYPGYKPEVRELPNGDGVVDAEKRYAHIALKYQTGKPSVDVPLWNAFLRAHELATQAALALNVPEEFMPSVHYSALRVLEYPVGAGGANHTDFDLLTVNLWRNDGSAVIVDASGQGRPSMVGLPPNTHGGEIAQELGLGRATPHSVASRDFVQQSLVFFAIPDWRSRLPSGVTVGNWIKERIERSRTRGYK